MRFRKFTGGVAVALSLGLLSGVAQAEDTTGQLTGLPQQGQADVILTSRGARGQTLVTNGTRRGASAAISKERVALNSTFGSYLLLGGLGVVQTSGAGSGTSTGGKAAGKGGTSALGMLGRTESALLLSGIFSAVGVGGSGGSGTGSEGDSSATFAPLGAGGLTPEGRVFQNRNRFSNLTPGSEELLVGTAALRLSANRTRETSSDSGATDNLGKLGTQGVPGSLNTTTTMTAVPEPGEWMAMGMATLFLGGLMFRARRNIRSRREVTAA